jgi:molecular chaperone GrpE
MSTEPPSPPPSATQVDPEAVPPKAETPRTPEELMQAASVRITELEAELAEMKDRWMRAEAETVNIRARAKREVDDARQYAVQSFAKDVVEAAENLRRGLEALPAPDEDEPEILSRLRTGFEGVERGFLTLLERHGVARQDPTGEPFDPNLHQAMAEQETTAHPPGTVVQAWTACWTLRGRLLRPAMVMVAKAPSPELPAEAPAANVEKLDRTV